MRTKSQGLVTEQEFHSDDRDLREILERRARQAVMGENSAQRKLHSTEYDVEIKNLERRNSEYALIESQRELESERLQLRQASQWADQAQREKINLCGELELRNFFHEESYARSCQETEELKRRCYREKMQ